MSQCTFYFFGCLATPRAIQGVRPGREGKGRCREEGGQSWWLSGRRVSTGVGAPVRNQKEKARNKAVNFALGVSWLPRLFSLEQILNEDFLHAEPTVICKTDTAQGPQELTVYGEDRMARSTRIGLAGDQDRGL